MRQKRLPFVQYSQTAAAIVRDDAATWLEAVRRVRAQDRLQIALHTFAKHYFPESFKTRALDALSRATSPVVQIGIAADGGEGTAITLTHWPSEISMLLGGQVYMDFGSFGQAERPSAQ